MNRNQYRLKLPQRHDKTICKTEVLVNDQIFRIDHEPVPASVPVDSLPRDEILIHVTPESDVTLGYRTTTLQMLASDWRPLGTFYSQADGVLALPVGSTLDLQFAGQIDVEPAPVAPVETATEESAPEASAEPVEAIEEPAPAKPAKKRTKRS